MLFLSHLGRTKKMYLKREKDKQTFERKDKVVKNYRR